MATMDLDEDIKMVLERLSSSRKHGTGTIIIEVRDHVVADVKETLDYRRGKEFAKKD